MFLTALQNRVTNLIFQWGPRRLMVWFFSDTRMGACHCWKSSNYWLVQGHTASWWQWGEEIQSRLSVFQANHQMTFKKHFWGWKVLYNYCFKYKYFPFEVKLFFFITTDFIKPVWLSLFKLLQRGSLKPCKTFRLCMQNLCSQNTLSAILNHFLVKILSLQFT